MAAWYAALPLIGGFLDGVFSGVDKLSTSDEERLAFKAQLQESAMPLLMAVVAADKAMMEAQARIREMELQSADVFVRRSRPAMVWVTFIHWMYTASIAPMMGLPHADPEVAAWMFGIVSGVWSMSRGVEKVTDKLKEKAHV